MGGCEGWASIILFFCHVCRVSGLDPGQAQCIVSQSNCFQSINNPLSECAQASLERIHLTQGLPRHLVFHVPTHNHLCHDPYPLILGPPKHHEGPCFPNLGATWGSQRLTSLCGYMSPIETHVLQVAQMLQRPISSSPGNLSALEICPVDPRRAQPLLFLSPSSVLTGCCYHIHHTSSALPPFSLPV